MGLFAVGFSGQSLDQIDDLAADLGVGDLDESAVQLKAFRRGQEVYDIVRARRFRHAGGVRGLLAGCVFEEEACPGDLRKRIRW